MKHELLIFISTLPCCLLLASVGIQLKQEPQVSQPNAAVELTEPRFKAFKENADFRHLLFGGAEFQYPPKTDPPKNFANAPVEPTEPRSSVPQPEETDYHQPLFGGVKIQMPPKTEIDQSGDQGRNFKIHVTQNNSYHDIDVPNSFAIDQDSPAIQKALHDLIFENSKQGAHSLPKCEYAEGKKCDLGKRVNDVDLPEEHNPRNKVVQNFKRPIITIPRGSELFPHHHNNTDNSSKIPIPEDEFPYNKSVALNGSFTGIIPTPADEFPYNESILVNTPPTTAVITPAEEFPYDKSVKLDKDHKFFTVPASIPNEYTTLKPTNNQWPTLDSKDEEQPHTVLEVVIAIVFFGSFCSILYYFYAGNIRSCNRRQRQILIEELDAEDGTRMEMNPRNQEEGNQEVNNGDNGANEECGPV